MFMVRTISVTSKEKKSYSKDFICFIMNYNILLIIYISSFKYSEEAVPFKVCAAVGHIGVPNVKFYGDKTSIEVSGDNTDTAYLINDPDTVFPCCGIIEEWDAYVTNIGEIIFDIWRSTDSTNFKLVGSNKFSPVTKKGEVVYNVPPGAQYTVLPGDYIGWYAPFKEMMAYTNEITGEATNVLFFKLRPSSFTEGLSLDWSMAESESGFTYLIRARYGVNRPPTFLNLDDAVEVYPPIPIGTVVYTIDATDPDISDTQLTYRMISGNGFFSFNPTTRKVSVAADLTTYVGYQCITFKVEDICTNNDTGSLCIFIHNEPPTVNCNPVTATVIETTAGNIALTTMDVSDPTDDVTCYLSRTSPKNSPFYLRQDVFDYMIYVNPNPGFRQATRDTYSVSVTCTDKKNSTTATCNIKILPSAPPKFTNLPGLVPLSTANVNTDPVYAVSVTDLDSTSFNYSMTCKPTPCPFTLYNTGNIQLNQDLIDHTVPGYDLFITVTDGYHSVTDTLTVTISGVNVPPKFSNLPLATGLYVQENIPPGSSVYQFSATDNDGDALAYSMTSSPGTGINYFSIDSSSGVISASTTNPINYEAMTDKVFTFMVSVTDGRHPVTQNLLIHISNVNEELSFAQDTYRIAANESLAGTQLPNPRFVVTDIDFGDTRTFKQDCGANNGYLLMNSANGILTFAVDYDLDVPGKPTMITCIVTATDSGGLTATTTLSITLKEVNDHTPTFSPSSYTFYVYNDSATGTVLGNLLAKDADIGTNGQFMFSINQAGLGQNYFDVSSTGRFTLQGSLNGIQGGTSWPFTVSATDSGSPSRVGSASILVIVLEATTTTASTTTTGYKTFIEDERNIVWIVFLALLALLVALLTAWVCWRYIRNWPIGFDPFRECCRNCRKPKWCRDLFKNCCKGSNRSRPVFKRSQPKSNKPGEETPRARKISSELNIPMAPARGEAAPSPMRLGDDPNFHVYNFWQEKWHGDNKMIV
ncbi:hypothetical protein CHS0354_034615 [Potamilus streckersoni]|uniref:Cadherin domain-containing protein n=1 Tax=Potamilus streckersoni TaxID=2493646 RepID=A0AAE0SSV2_9BIVA|nr:hypothetical protein CHS0354_034615 [Potamilus streckersoni]